MNIKKITPPRARKAAHASQPKKTIDDNPNQQIIKRLTREFKRCNHCRKKQELPVLTAAKYNYGEGYADLYFFPDGNSDGPALRVPISRPSRAEWCLQLWEHRDGLPFNLYTTNDLLMLYGPDVKKPRCAADLRPFAARMGRELRAAGFQQVPPRQRVQYTVRGKICKDVFWWTTVGEAPPTKPAHVMKRYDDERAAWQTECKEYVENRRAAREKAKESAAKTMSKQFPKLS